MLSHTDSQKDTIVRADSLLVEMGRDGNQEAFGELVARYRVRAFGWAKSFTRDGHLAEDIVQEALIRAFMNLGRLINPSRFQPWLRTIVRNEAYMKLRRGGPFRNEQPFSSIELEAEDSREEIDLGDLDLLIYQMIRQSHEAAQSDSDPAEQLIRSEMFQTFREMLHCLTLKEREIFEAAFFRQLSPGQIAELLGTTTGSVYSHLSRSRHKLQRERIRVYINGYVQMRRDGGKPNRVMLDSTEIYLKPKGGFKNEQIY